MTRTLTLLPSLLTAAILQAQTFFYIDQITVVPNPATTSDDVQVQLIGNLSSTGSYIVSAQASVTGNLVSLTVVAASTGGLTVLVPHTETIALGQLPPGTYSIAFTLGSSGILDLAPADQHSFTVSGSSNACDQLDILSVHWAPFTDTALVINVANNSAALFDYPNFILLGTAGDTLAQEAVSFFGLAGESWHVLRLQDGVSFIDPFVSGTLELWTGFTTTLACSWNLEDAPLCPPPPCAPITFTLGNFGGQTISGDFGWTLTDASFAPFANGIFTLDPEHQSTEAAQCLPPGHYGLAVAPLGAPPPGGSLFYGVSGQGGITGPSHAVSWDLPVIMPFSFYAPCTEGSTGFAMTSAPAWTVGRSGDEVIVRNTAGLPIGMVSVHDAVGRTVAIASSASNELRLTCPAQGLILVRADGQVWKLAP